MTVEQLDLLDLIEKDDLIKSRLNYILPLLELRNINIEVVAVNKYYEWSFLGKENGSLNCYSIYKRVNGDIDLRRNGHLMYPFERVMNGTLNFILVS